RLHRWPTEVCPMPTTVRLAGSAWPRPRGSVTTRPLTAGELATTGVVTVHLREDPSADSVGVRLARQHLMPAAQRVHLRASELAALHGAHPGDVGAVGRWASAAGLRMRRPAGATNTV